VWTPTPQNAVAVTVCAAIAAGISSVAVSAAVTPLGTPTDKVTAKARDLLPSTVKKWLADFIKSKRKSSVEEKTGSRFLPTKSEAIAYAVTIAALALAFSYVKVDNLTDIFQVLPLILGTSILFQVGKAFALIVFSRNRGVWTEFKLWYFGLATFLIFTFAFRIPFSSPSRRVHYSAKLTKRLDAIISTTSILLDFTFAGIFELISLSGSTLIGNTGLSMCLISALLDTFPISPMSGKSVFDHNKGVWLALLIVSASLFGAWIVLSG
jgi:hypothetical protein